MFAITLVLMVVSSLEVFDRGDLREIKVNKVKKGVKYLILTGDGRYLFTSSEDAKNFSTIPITFSKADQAQTLRDKIRMSTRIDRFHLLERQGNKCKYTRRDDMLQTTEYDVFNAFFTTANSNKVRKLYIEVAYADSIGAEWGLKFMDFFAVAGRLIFDCRAEGGRSEGADPRGLHGSGPIREGRSEGGPSREGRAERADDDADGGTMVSFDSFDCEVTMRNRVTESF